MNNVGKSVLFPCGRLAVTQHALDWAEQNNINLLDLLRRHQRGD